ncbi:hypothetical protein M422DRAFT_37967 [Sphaerobolus stellatus SS14]|uniref:Uncharacterized protein n=1 Tax=Sphaerobolus stellatus (strain SS14) TaxID=990650 RepID=A0A0C9UNJ1_SPHS4|nr:hypothetical protein M422DRAFT_37967 [Sphaerobolus stellatus SS14]
MFKSNCSPASGEKHINGVSMHLADLTSRSAKSDKVKYAGILQWRSAAKPCELEGFLHGQVFSR